MTPSRILPTQCPQCGSPLQTDAIAGGFLQTCGRCAYRVVIRDPFGTFIPGTPPTPDVPPPFPGAGGSPDAGAPQPGVGEPRGTVSGGPAGAGGRPNRVLGSYRRRPELIYRAALQSIRAENAWILQTDREEWRVDFEWSDRDDRPADRFELFVFTGDRDTTEVEIRCRSGQAAQMEFAESLLREIGKYVALADGPARPEEGWRDRGEPRRAELPYQRPALGYSQSHELPVSGMAIAGFVLSILSLIFWICLSVPFAILGLTFSLVARGQAGRTSCQGLAIAGWIISTVVLGIWALLILIAAATRSWHYW